MKKTAIIASLAIGALTLSGCAAGGSSGGTPAAGGEGETFSLVLGHSGSQTDPRQTAALALKEIVETESDGRVTIEVHADSTLGTWEEMIEGLQLGSADIVIESLLSLESYTDLSGVETAPFLYESPEQFFEVWDGELGAEIKGAITDASGYSILGNMYRGPRELTTKEPVTTLDQLKGLTIRTPSAPTMLATWEALGARAEALPFNEVYSALESGVLDGQENPLDAILFNSIHEVAPNIGETSHMYANYHFLMWEDALAGLPEDVQDLVRDAADRVGAQYTADTIENTATYRADLEAAGAVFNKITDRPKWVQATQPLIEKLPAQVQEWVAQIRG
ncbi:TRAP transporter substrate-binding protein [Microterricola viridarii]|uniref:Tripartite ATP-independent transporter solute receptor, DctP family n=1 Tax=Microterricola viridarii TaxID=412690 RepID=A0A1H1QCV2_9MICO|nr:TRAP transporter substrate-binding protein [Microterricola viridarii]SDS21260.1 tripartite ATP-independent transporter solute receptor, DctP family [Microterricola viridarii]